ncbi:maleylpyruvate isomerase family mycothiol-dependent enzyme [Saccharothrix deserti]|uniref:maleylpyruvate isomerase family mycothiol-dependent enzyme n=1 Tax=Saccharothrix deserti TaxID=2593674 RepID=UPI00131EA370|nr:maleylpyruvate isomerase family mycothiol-dependent enzyme [Saccharothrix deserti]
MKVHDMIVDERLRMADLLDGLDARQLATPSLPEGWTVHDVGAHLITYLRFGRLKLYWGIGAMAADFDRLNRELTARAARMSTSDITDRMRRWAKSKVSIPRSGYDPVLADILLHDYDVRVPLVIERAMPEDRLWVAFQHLAAKPSPGYAMGGRLANLRLEAVDTGWSHGTGPVVRGSAEPLVLAMSGRAAGFAELAGDGLSVLRQRVAAPPPRGPAQRLKTVINVLVDPPPPERRSRSAAGGS